MHRNLIHDHTLYSSDLLALALAYGNGIRLVLTLDDTEESLRYVAAAGG